MTYIVLIDVGMDIQFVDPHGTLKGVEKGALCYFTVGPNSGHLFPGSLRGRGRQSQGKLLGYQHTSFHIQNSQFREQYSLVFQN
jgi:hypothetical protein